MPKSVAEDKQAFLAEHAKDWIAIGAMDSKAHAGFVNVFAAVGGEAEVDHSDCETFLVPEAEYRKDWDRFVEKYGGGECPFGFVVDPSRHPRAAKGPPHRDGPEALPSENDADNLS